MNNLTFPCWFKMSPLLHNKFSYAHIQMLSIDLSVFAYSSISTMHSINKDLWCKSLSILLFSSAFSWLFHTLSFEMKCRISISSYKTTNHKKTKKVLDRFSLNLCMNLETIGIFTVLSFFLQGRNIHFIYSGLLLCCHGIFQLIWYSAHAWMKNRMEDLYKLILRRVCVRMT